MVSLPLTEYQTLLNAASSVPSILDELRRLSAMLDALRSQYVELLIKLRDIEDWL